MERRWTKPCEDPQRAVHEVHVVAQVVGIDVRGGEAKRAPEGFLCALRGREHIEHSSASAGVLAYPT